MNERKMSRNIELIETDKKETDVIQTHPNNPEAIEGSLLVEKNNILEVPLYQKTFINSCQDACCQCCKKVDMIHRREVYINEDNKHTRNYTRFPNRIKNQKYNVVTFLPVVLFNQFKFFNNQFYLLMAISQFVDELKVGFLFSYISPLVFVLVVTLIRELIDDCKRHFRDKELNNQKFKVLTQNGKKDICSKDIKIGDLLILEQGQRVPADVLILKTFDSNIYIKTDQLDGETDWKLRKPIPYFNQLNNFEKEIFRSDTLFRIEAPSRHIYDFTGVLEISRKVNSKSENFGDNSVLTQSDIIRQGLSLENTIWMNAVLASKQLYGVVIYTGKETRAEMNSSTPKEKLGKLDREINLFTKLLFIVMIILSILLVCLKGLSRDFVVNLIVFSRFIVLFCSIIPISLKINMDISKSYFAQKISNDNRIEGAIARNSTIPEELGRIEFIFSDKTGTLTKNEMVFKKIAMEIGIFQQDNLNDIKDILNEECQLSHYPMNDLISMVNSQENAEEAKKNFFDNPKRIRRNRNKLVRDSITAITLCNNVTPIFNGNTGAFDYQASSPDEIALVQFSENLNMRLTYRDDETIIITDNAEHKEEYQILAIFPFSSDTKRMGIVLLNKESNKKIFYLKGAENVVCNFVKDDYKSFIQENAELLANSGLRTLVICQKLLDDEFFEKWNAIYQKACLSMHDRKRKIENAMNLLENKMEFLCVTGVEDKLQDQVTETIESLKNAGIRIWMLTGDKVETATCIAISTGLKSKNQNMYLLKDLNTEEEINKQLEDLKSKRGFLLMIDCNCLDACLKYCAGNFFKVATYNASCVACCRCSPTQKARIISLIKKYTTAICLAIGDGGNDVAMIQEAHVGVGILGKEGKQASLSADFSLNRFKDLNLLLLWFGRLSYKNTSTIAHFVIHRGLIISFLQFLFSLVFYYLPIALYNGMLVLGYSTIYTALPVLSIMLDEDTNINNVVKFPSLYRELIKGREMSSKKFLIWFFKSLFQSVIIMAACLIYFDRIFIFIATVTFTCLILAELLNVYTEIHKFHWFMIVSLLLTLLSYGLSLTMLKSIFNLSYLNWENFFKILAVTVISWLPFFLANKLQKIIFPETYEKLNQLN